MKDFSSMAATLYDGGWRAEDLTDIIEEYDLEEEDAEEIVKLLKYYEENK